MKRTDLLTGAILFLLGMAGVFSIITMDLPLPEDVQTILSEQFTPLQIKLLLLVNPTILLIFAVLLGILLGNKTGLDAPWIRSWVDKNVPAVDVRDLALYGVLGGVIAGVAIVIVGLIYEPLLPEAFLELSNNIQTGLAARLLYGGITEEILMRFGLMTLVVWILMKITGGVSPRVYWTAIVISSLLFAVGHFPVAIQAVGDPSALLLSYIVIGNTLGGVVFGWLYWKKGLESAMLAHMFAHVVMLLADWFMG